MSFAELIEGSSFVGAPTRLDVAAATRLGRAFGTALRRRSGGGAQVVVVARRSHGEERALRDGLVRGLLLAGHRVCDVGVVDDGLLAFAVEHLGAAGSAVASAAASERGAIELTLGRRALQGEALSEVATLADGDDQAAGEGSLSVLDLGDAWRAAQRTGAAP